MTKSFACIALLTLIALPSTGCTKDRSTFAPAWKAAVQTKDGRAAFNLLDRATRDKVTAGLKKSQDKAASDEAFKRLFAAAGAPADTTRPPEELAAALLAEQIAAGQADITDDGKTVQIHLDDGGWRVSADPVGFVDPEGAPLTLYLRLPGAPVPQPPPGITSFEIHVERNGKTTAEIQAEQVKAVTRVAELAHLADGYLPSATKLLGYYADVPDEQAIDRRFVIERDGSITPVFTVFDRQTLGEQSKPRPKLTFGPWK